MNKRNRVDEKKPLRNRGFFADLESKLSAEATIWFGTPAEHLYARDSWPELLLRTRKGEHSIFPPDAIVIASSVEDVIETVRWCRDHDVPLVPYGAGSGVTGAIVPVFGGVVLDLKRLTSLDLSMKSDHMIRAGAGWLGMRLEEALQRHDLTLGHFPSSIGCSTLGGYLATRSAGQFSTRYGKIEDMAISVRYVDVNGEIHETFVAGDDESQLLIGSEGTFGIIVDAWVKVEPIPKEKRYRGFLAPSVEEAFEAMRWIMQSGYRPTCLRLYDSFDTFIHNTSEDKKDPDKNVDKKTPQKLFKRIRATGSSLVDKKRVRKHALSAVRSIVSRTIGAPLLANQIADRAFSGCLLIVGIEENDATHADAIANEMFGELRKSLKDLGAGPGEHWLRNRYNISYKQSIVYDAGMFVDTMEVATSWENLPRLYAEVRRAVGRHVFIMAHFSHAYRSGCSIYFTFAGLGKDDEHCLKLYRRAWRSGLDAVARTGAAVTHHHGVGLLKADRLYSDHIGGRGIFDAVKSLADPNMILNPGKLWDAQLGSPTTL